MYCFLDTETTGFSKKGDLVQPGQARVVQLAAILTDDTGKHMAEFCTLIEPDGWRIEPGAEAIHGISLERCERFGIPALHAVSVVHKMMQQAQFLVCHNVAFDDRMLDIEYAYLNKGRHAPITKYCTMLASMDICKLPGQYNNFKWPKLKEALPIMCGVELGEDAHDAMVDTKGCKQLFFELLNRGLVPGALPVAA